MLPEVYFHMASQFLSVKYTQYGLFIKSLVYLGIYFEMQTLSVTTVADPGGLRGPWPPWPCENKS